MNATEIDTDFLEELFADEIKCESKHSIQKVCTHEVVALKSSICGAHFLICSASYHYNLDSLENGVFDCSGCGNPAQECWTIRPI